MLSFDLADYVPKNLDISAGVPFSFNVVPWKICLAILLGYKKIILYGCEQDLFINFKHAFKTKKDILKHRKLSNSKLNTKIDTLYPDTSNYISLFLSLNMLKCHKNLKKFAKSRNVKIINCTPGGILDMYKKDDIKKYI